MRQKHHSLFHILLFLCTLSLFNSSNVFAAEDPINMLRRVTDNVMHVLRENRDELKQNPKRIYGIVNQTIIPYVDFIEMGKWVVGRNAWNGANSDTQQAFIDEFRKLVVRTYANSLLNYSDQTIDFLPLRMRNAEGRIQVSSVIRNGGKDIHIDYRLIQENDTWKVYDIIIEGVSLMQGYRAQFAQDVQRGGLPAVVTKLKDRNSKGITTPPQNNT